jgi:uncharacterized protein YifE (UPF0438 family)
MRTAVRLTLLFVSLSLLACAARAQPTRPAPTRDARCKTAADRYASVVSAKEHRTVEEQSRVEYDEAVKYLRACWEASDDFTRSLKKYVAMHEDFARCEDAWTRFGPRIRWEGSGTTERSAQVYEAAKEFLRICDGAETDKARFVRSWVEKYDAAVRRYEAEKTLASLVEEAQRGSTQPSVYSRMAEALVATRYEPEKRRLLTLIESGKSLDSKDVREAWAGVTASLDSIVGAYARAIALCRADDGCQVARGSWMGNLAKYYALRHDGSEEGLQQTIAHALDVPLPKP